jgi:rubrerythrin
MDEMEILKSALKLEQNGEAFYENAKQESSDKETAALYQTLADDERLHAAQIEKQIAALEGGGAWQAAPELDDVEPADIDAPIFEINVDLLEALPEEATEEDALLFALGAEVKTFELYIDGAKSASSAVGRDWFLRLAEVERGHFDLLMMRYESRFGYPR